MQPVITVIPFRLLFSILFIHSNVSSAEELDEMLVNIYSDAHRLISGRHKEVLCGYISVI